MKSKTLFIIASDYPYGPGEPFLETELKYISSEFARIFFIITTPGISNNNARLFYVPGNAGIIFMNKTNNLLSKILSLRFLFRRIFYSELFIMKRYYKVPTSILVFKIMLSALLKADLSRKEIIALLKAKNIPYDKCVFYSYWNNEFSLSLAMLKMKHPQLKVFTRTHGNDLYFERHDPPYLPFRTFNLLHFDAVFTISENGKKYIFEKNKHIRFDNIIISRLGTPPGSFRSEYKRGNTVKILSIAYLFKVKRIGSIIDALSVIDFLNVEWTHIGGGKTFESLQKYAELKTGNKKNINNKLKGNLTKDEIYSLLRDEDFDFLINTSSTEGIPVSMMEAMSFGIPVLGTNVGGVQEIIEDNFNGFLMPPDPSPQEIANLIEKMAKIPEQEYYSLRENAYNTWLKKFNAEVNYNKFADELGLIIQG